MPLLPQPLEMEAFALGLWVSWGRLRLLRASWKRFGFRLRRWYGYESSAMADASFLVSLSSSSSFSPALTSPALTSPSPPSPPADASGIALIRFSSPSFEDVVLVHHRWGRCEQVRRCAGTSSITRRGPVRRERPGPGEARRRYDMR